MANLLKSFLLTLAASGAVTAASAGVVTVAATRDIFLASQPHGSPVTGYFGTDTAPGASPVALDVSGGATLTFSATGSSSVDGSCFAGADGGCYPDESGFSPAPASGTYKGPATALIGVFLGSGVTDVSMGPASLDYTQAGNQSLASQSPSLDQIFFIGDGLTGTGTGAVQTFIAPMGAAKLYIAVADSIGASGGNPGSLVVQFTGATLAAAVPEPAAWALMLIGFGGVGAMARRRPRPATPTQAF
jgi:hypothetical protein